MTRVSTAPSHQPPPQILPPPFTAQAPWPPSIQRTLEDCLHPDFFVWELGKLIPHPSLRLFAHFATTSPSSKKHHSQLPTNCVSSPPPSPSPPSIPIHPSIHRDHPADISSSSTGIYLNSSSRSLFTESELAVQHLSAALAFIVNTFQRKTCR